MCVSVPEVCPADATQGLHVFLTDAVSLRGQSAHRVLLLSPLALCKHRSRTINTHTHTVTETSNWVWDPVACSTPVLLQGGEVGQQALMVELLKLQELNRPLVWKHRPLKRAIQRLWTLMSQISIFFLIYLSFQFVIFWSFSAHLQPSDSNSGVSHSCYPFCRRWSLLFLFHTGSHPAVLFTN